MRPTALVTGAAGGIGSAIAQALARRGHVVAATDTDLAAVQRACDRIAESLADVPHEVTVRAFHLDVTDTRSVEAAVTTIERELGPVDVLVNAAGVLSPSLVDLTEADVWERTFAVNSGGPFRVGRAVGRRMAARGRGSIVTVGSNAGAVPRVGMAAYAASKAAAIAFTRCLGLELASSGVRCNVVSPGSTRTAMLDQLWEADPLGEAVTLKGSLDDFRVGIPLGRVAEPSDVAEAVAFLSSPEARHITLANLTVDGGAALGV